jgi:hypothetical protein
MDNLLMLSEEEYLALAISRAYKKTYDEDIIFNRESHGRDDTIANLNRTVGWFTSQYPVHVKVNNTWREGVVWIKVNSQWKEAEIVKTRVSGTWREST